MTELRSFIIGVTIAAAVLGVAALVFGAFNDDGDGSPSVVLLGTPPASRTPEPAATREPAPTNTPEQNPPASGGETPEAQATEANGGAEPTATPEIAPTLEPTPAGPTVEGYVANANPLTQNINAQLAYLAGNLASPNVNDQAWRDNTLLAAQNVQQLAAAIGGLAAPECLVSAQGTLAAGANQANAAAAEVTNAVNASDAAAANAAAASVNAANDAINGGIAAINAAAC